MAHMHDDVHSTTREVDVIDRGNGSGFGAGFMLAIATLLVLAVIGVAVLWARPWDDNSNNNTPNVPGISDNSGGGSSGGGQPSGGGSDSGGGGAQPAQ